VLGGLLAVILSEKNGRKTREMEKKDHFKKEIKG
jgi:hypothetical protein